MSQERTYEPTAKKLAAARRQGLMPQSRDLVSAFVLLGAWLVLRGCGEWMVDRFQESWRIAMHAVSAADEIPLTSVLSACSWLGVQAMAPLAITVAAVGALVSLVQVRPGLFSGEPLTKSHPFGLSQGARTFGLKTRLADLTLAALKAGVLIFTAGHAIYEQLRGVVGMVQGSADRTLYTTATLGGAVILRMAAALLAIGALDYLFQRYRFLQEMKMSREELERERKESEVDPRLKAKRHAIHQQWVVDGRGRAPDGGR